jgi:hypothetical protein
MKLLAVSHARLDSTVSHQESIVKMTLITLIATIMLGGALPAIGGPDWQVIDQARKAQRTAQTAQPDVAVAADTSAGACKAEHQFLPLDHGPRAQTTRYINQLSAARLEQELRACQAARQKGVEK